MDDSEDLVPYNRKRDFTKTAEPKGRVAKKKGFRYLIQKHDATRLHYDFRLELDGVLKSWAVTRGPSLDPNDKRLAVEVEDHPVSYGSFEGTIPKGQYGGGTVMLWDEGWWEPENDPHEGLKTGDLKFTLHGKRLTGSWVLVRMRGRPQDKGRNNWLLIKHPDEMAKDGDAEAWLEENAASITSARTMDEIAAGKGKVWETKKTRPPVKADAEKSVKTPTAKSPLTFIPPELATLADEAPKGGNWVHEVKFDGYRMQGLIEKDTARLLTRTGLDRTSKFTPIVDLLSSLPVQSGILDGEIVALNERGASSFSTLQDALSTGHAADLQYYVFDLLNLNGDDMTRLPLLQRKARLEAILKGHDSHGRIVYSEHFANGDFLDHVCQLDMEGIISKRADARYTGGRNRNWLKIKCHKRQEFVIGGFTEPTHAVRGIGALLLGYYENDQLIYAGKVGTGFNDNTSAALRQKLDDLIRAKQAFAEVPGQIRRSAQWVEPQLVCEIEFSEWTPDGHLRHPSFQGLREDKPAAEVGRDRALQTSVAAQTPEVHSMPAKVRSHTQKAEVGGITISHPDRIIYPGTAITKLDLAHFYLSVADVLLPHVANRPLSMMRCPEGIGEACFFQRHIATGQSPHLYDTGIPVKGRNEDYMMIKDVSGLISLVQWGVIELHPWGCTADKPDLPDKIIFDLDPDPDVSWDEVVAGAHEVRSRMAEFGLQTFIKTTGGKGLHIVIPITRKYSWPAIKAFAHAIAQSMESDDPKRFIATMSKAARKGKIFVDYLRTELTATAVAPYSVRARPGATVATPIFWEELKPDLRPSDFTITTVPERLKAQKVDPWSDFIKIKQDITAKWLEALHIDAQ